MVCVGIQDILKPFLALYGQDRGVLPRDASSMEKHLFLQHTSRYGDDALTYVGFLQVTTLDFGGDFCPVLLAPLWFCPPHEHCIPLS